MSRDTTTSTPATAGSVLAEITDILLTVLDRPDLEDAEIGMGSRFHDDLGLESIDLVRLAGEVRVRYGDRVNFAEFIASLEIDEIIELTIGRLVVHIVGSLHATEQA